MRIERGNYFRQDYELTEPTEITGGNFVLCRVTNVRNLTIRGTDHGDRGGAYDLTVTGGNVRGLTVNGVKLDTYVWRRYEPLALAQEILAGVARAGGDDAVAAWLYTCEYLLAHPAATYQEWLDAYVAWSEGTGNTIYSAKAFLRIRDRWFSGQTFNQVRDAINGHELETWRGEPTQLVEEVS